MEGLKKRINELITNLKYFVKINGIIFKLDNNKKLNHEIITNIKNLKTQFDEKISTFLNESDFNNSVFFLLNSFDYKKIDKEKKKYVVEKDNKSKVYNFNINRVKDYPLEEKINVMCELKSKNLLAFGGESGKIYLYDKNFIKAEFDIANEEKSIKYLCELKDGFLVACTSDYFKTYEIKIENNLKEFHVIQKIDYLEKNFEDSKFKVAELRNGKLLSADGSLVKIWRKKLNNNLYDLEHEIKMNDLIFDLFEMNINKFVIYTINDNIQIVNSESYECKCNEHPIKDDNNNNWNIVSVQKLNEDNIMIVEKNMILLYSLIINNIQKCDSPKNIDGLYMLNNSRNQFYIYNTKVENTQYCLAKYEYSVIKNVYKSINPNGYFYNQKIGFIYKLSVNEENGKNKNFLLVKFNAQNIEKRKKELVLIFEEMS